MWCGTLPVFRKSFSEAGERARGKTAKGAVSMRRLSDKKNARHDEALNEVFRREKRERDKSVEKPSVRTGRQTSDRDLYLLAKVDKQGRCVVWHDRDRKPGKRRRTHIDSPEKAESGRR